MRQPGQKSIFRVTGNARPVRKGLAFLFLCAFLFGTLFTGCGTEIPQTQPAPVAEPAPEPSVPSGEEELEETAPEEPEADDDSPEARLERDIRAGKISWDNAPEIRDLDSLIAYMRRVRDARITEAPVIYTDGYMADYEEILKAVNFAYIDFEIRSGEEDSSHVLYTLTYYPGDRVADAYLIGNTEGLTEEEQYLYREAAFLADEAKKLPSDLHRELFFHDQIIGRATYHNRKERVGVPRFCTAVGAMLDGQANCQGYVDAFSMLARMAGFTVGKQSGYAGDAEHVWNTILLDGKWYAVDCTWDDASYTLNGTEYTSYAYFNAPAEILNTTHSQEDYTTEHPIVERLAEAKDYFYTTALADDSYFGHYSDSMDALAADAAERMERGAAYVYAMAPADEEHFSRYSDVKRAIRSHLSSSAKDMKFVLILTTRGDMSFVTIDVSGREREAGEETQSAGALEDLTVREDGVYTTAEDVSLYLHLYGKLPRNFMTKQEARALGWEGGSLEPYAEGMCIGGDRFGNYEGILPEGGKYRECDIDTLGASSRGAKRLIYSEDGSIWYTEDHYASFRQLY